MKVLFDHLTHASRQARQEAVARLERLAREHADLFCVHVCGRQHGGAGDAAREVRLTGEMRGPGPLSVASRADSDAVALRDATEAFVRAVRRRRGRRLPARHDRHFRPRRGDAARPD